MWIFACECETGKTMDGEWLTGLTGTHGVDEEWCNTSDSFHQSAVVKQSMLGQRCQGFNGLTHHSLLWVTQTLSVRTRGGGGGMLWQGSAYCLPVVVDLHHILAQGVVTPISTVLRAATGDCDPVYGGCRCGLPYYSVKVTQSRWSLAAQ